jgi:hypothetical protein
MQTRLSGWDKRRRTVRSEDGAIRVPATFPQPRNREKGGRSVTGLPVVSRASAFALSRPVSTLCDTRVPDRRSLRRSW